VTNYPPSMAQFK